VLGLRGFLLDDFDHSTRISFFVELQDKILGAHRITLVIKGNGARDAFEVFQFPYGRENPCAGGLLPAVPIITLTATFSQCARH
jgi:hypothetical protein